MAQYLKIETLGSIWSIILATLEVQVVLGPGNIRHWVVGPSGQVGNLDLRPKGMVCSGSHPGAPDSEREILVLVARPDCRKLLGTLPSRTQHTRGLQTARSS